MSPAFIVTVLIAACGLAQADALAAGPNQAAALQEQTRESETKSPSAEASRAQLETRADAYFQALKVRDWHTAYRMTFEASEGTLTPFAFWDQVQKSRATLVDYDIAEVTTTSPFEATVQVSATYTLPALLKPYQSTMQTHWVLKEGTWFWRTSAERPTDDTAAAASEGGTGVDEQR
jgi:hypothetical protein